ncbi:MAG: hypothetical protein HY861_01695 [Chlamydiia bacterium]|nr:hypothetical protein [Chlamydiia bacterium]
MREIFLISVGFAIVLSSCWGQKNTSVASNTPSNQCPEPQEEKLETIKRHDRW